MGTRKTTEIRTGDRATTPDGERTGLVRRTYSGGVMGDRPGVTSVQFQRGSVRAPEGTRPRGWALDVPDDADWTVED